MKKKFKFGGLKVKISWKFSRLWKSWFEKEGYTLPPKPVYDAELRLEAKLYRLFKAKYCEFFPGKHYGLDGREKSCFVYYKGCTEVGCERCLIGELMFGEDKISFFKRKGILYTEDLREYTFTMGEEVLARFDKEWVAAQGQYQ